MGTTGWMGFKDLEKALDIHSNTLRRWNELFPTFLGGKKINRVMSFPKESLETFRMIKILYDEGKQTADVIATLAKEMAQTLDVTPMPRDADAHPADPPAPGRTDLDTLTPILERFASALEKIAENGARALDIMDKRLTALESGPNSPSGASSSLGQGNVHGKASEAKDGPHMARPDSTKLYEVRMPRQEVIAEVRRLRSLGYGAARIRTAMVRAGFPSLNGKGQLSKSTVARIVKGEISN